jgi:hypothetical protein
MEVTLTGKANTAINLDGIGDDVSGNVGAIRLGHSHGLRRFGVVVVQGPSGVVHQRAGIFDLYQHIHQLVLYRLIAANGMTEGNALLGIRCGHCEGMLCNSGGFSTPHQAGLPVGCLQNGQYAVEWSQQGSERHSFSVESHLEQSPGRINALQRRGCMTLGRT